MALNSVAEDVRTLLNANSKGTEGTDLFSFQWGSADDGDEIDKQILVIELGSDDGGLKVELEIPTFQILVRGDTNEGVKSVHDRARDIFEFMCQQVRQTINGTEYVEFEPQGGPIPLGKDDNNRHLYSMNFFTFRESIGA